MSMWDFVHAGFAWVLQASWKTSVLICLVLLVQWMLRHRLAPRWRFALWSIVVIRLLAPGGLPESPVSIYSLAPTPIPMPIPQPPPIYGSAGEKNALPAPDVRPAGETRMTHREPQLPNTGPHQVLSAAKHAPSATDASSETPTTPSPSLLDWLASIWLLGMLALGAASTSSFLRFRRRLAHARPVTDPRLLRIVHCCHLDLGLTRHIPVLETTAVSSPTLFGVARPWLLLPQGLMGRLSATELHHVILHELLHHKRRDAWVNCLVGALCGLHWFNPLAWVTAWRVRFDLEMACDADVVEQLPRGHSRRYGETIVKCLESCVAASNGSGLRMWTHKGEMRQRLDSIVRISTRRKSIGIALIAALALILTGLTDPRLLHRTAEVGAVASDAPPANGNAALERQSPWDFICWDPIEQAAVPNAAMRVELLLPDGSVTELQGLTDARGEWKVEPPALLARILRVSADKPGYLPRAQAAKDDGRIDPILIRQCFLSRPERIGGTIIDPTGTPVEGAVITATSRQEMGDTVITYGAGQAVTTTDAEGNWRLDDLNSACIFELTVMKPGYASRTNQYPGPSQFSFQPNALRLGSDMKLFLAKPTDIQGSVVDWRGEAVADASVAFRREWDGFQTNTVSGSDGRFSFLSIPPDYSALQNNPSVQELTLLVQSTNFAPVVRTLPRELSTIAGLRVVLNPGQRFEGRVVDQDEQPVSNAEVWTDFGSTMTTDEQGVFVIEHAPERLQVTVQKEGYDPVQSAVLIPYVQTNAIILRRLGLIQGTVSDSVTGAPLPSFGIKLIPADISSISNEPSPVIMTNFTAGRFTLAPSANYPSTPYPGTEWRLLIQALDYETVLTEVVDRRSGDVTLDIVLDREPWIHGRVLSADGKPVQGATVSYVSGNVPPWSRHALFGHRHSDPIVSLVTGTPARSQADGRFQMPRVDASTLEALNDDGFPKLSRPGLDQGTNDFIVVRHELGFVECTLESFPDDGNLMLQAPGSIKGRVGDAPAVQPAYNVQVARITDGNLQITPCSPGGEPAPTTSPDFLTLDEQGAFEAHNLYPGSYELVLMLPLGGGSFRSSHSERVEVLAGNTTEVTLLQATRMATGRVVCTNLPGFDWSQVHTGFGMSAQGVQGQIRMVASTSHSIQPGTKLGDRIPLRLQPDGAFLAANLVPGTYELSITVGDSGPHMIEELKTRSRDNPGSMSLDPRGLPRFRAPGRPIIFEKLSAVAKPQLDHDDWMMGAVPIGYLSSTVEIPAGPADQQVDLGTFELFSLPRLELNEAAPAFDIATLDGGRLRLSDYRGKWLTLFFWHSGKPGSTCETELLYLKGLWQKFQDHPRLALAGVVLDENPGSARDSAGGGPQCPQGFDGGWKTSQIAKQFGVVAVPSVFLIHPDGRIAGYNLWTQPLADALEKIAATQEQK